MNNNTTKTIVITGCSSGFGRITALQLARQRWHVFGTVRKDSDKDDLIHTLEAEYQAYLTPVVCDITHPEQVTALAATVAASTSRLDALLNNAEGLLSA